MMNEDELIQLSYQYPFSYDYVMYCYSLGFTERADLEWILQLSLNPSFRPEHVLAAVNTLAQ